MKIIRAIINNFRCYHGQQIPIEFETEGKITLVYGAGGAGKTSLLDFFNWTFYGVDPKDKDKKTKNNKPLYNNKSMADLVAPGDLIVSGTIVFVHKNVEYKLIREKKFHKTTIGVTPLPDDLKLYYRNVDASNDDNIGFIPYNKNVIEKINEIAPQSLSRYFFFAGEDGGELANSDLSLANSIYSMFDLKKYDEALRHLGSTTSRPSLLCQYSKEKVEHSVKGKVGDMEKTYKSLLSAAQYKETYEKKYKEWTGYVKDLNEKIKKLYKDSGELGGKSAEDITKTIEKNKKEIESKFDSMQTKKYEIGRKLAQVSPYLLLCDKALEVRNSLAMEVSSDDAKRKQMESFVDLSRPLLEDIMSKKRCVCGRKLDNESEKYIEDTLKLLPPSSYSLIFQQFVDSTKNKLYSAETRYENIDSLLAECLQIYEDVDSLVKENDKKLKELASIDKEKLEAIANEIREKEDRLKKYEDKQKLFFSEMEKGRKAEMQLSSDYEKMLKAQGFKNDIDDKLEILTSLKKDLQLTFDKKKLEVKNILEDNIKKIYYLLSTRKEDFSKKDFLKLDFSLRDEYKSGSQTLVDVYSYVIGMAKSLSETGNSDSEFPVIVDAPFSAMDGTQLAHLIDTMPKIVSQVAMFTFDTTRLKEFADVSAIGTVWELVSDETQEITFIRRGEL